VVVSWWQLLLLGPLLSEWRNAFCSAGVWWKPEHAPVGLGGGLWSKWSQGGPLSQSLFLPPPAHALLGAAGRPHT
jgi:hypothetical protein